MNKVALLFSLLFLCAFPPLSAHPELLAQIIQDLENDPENIPLLMEKAQTLIDMEIYDEAEETLIFIEQLQPEVSAESTYLHILLHFSRDEKERAYKMSERGIKAFPNSSLLWDMRGQMFSEDERVSEAIEAFSKSLKLNEEATTGYYMRLAGLILERDAEGDPEKALGVIQEGLTKLGPNSGLLQFRIRLNRDLENFDAALGDIDKLEEQFGFQMNFITDRAKILTLAGRTEEAIKAYDEGIGHINADPANAEKKYMQRMKGNLEEAKAELQPTMAERE
ncbi:MAG: hypothetical protein AAGA96_13075 [Verrucomicrobiota bacterium]